MFAQLFPGQTDQKQEALDFVKRIDVSRFQKELDVRKTKSSSPYHDEVLFPKHKYYEPVWLPSVEKLKRWALDGETNLARLVSRFENEEPVSYFGNDVEAVWMGKLVSVPRATLRANRDAVRLAFLLENCRPETSAVLDLGAGRALLSFRLWLSGGPLRAKYHALEISESGRLFVDALRRFEPALSMEARFFDYHRPNFDFVKLENHRDVLVFSHGSIEQVETLPYELFTKLLDLAPAVRGVHLEPVGWQIEPPPPGDALLEAHKERCLKFRYNTNLWALLNRLQDEGRIRIDRCVPNLCGKKEHFESYISWHKTSGKAG